jgi:hypothetical protein
LELVNIFRSRLTGSKYCLVLHPAVRLSFFQSPQWNEAIDVRTKSLLLKMVKKYAQAGNDAVGLPVDIEAVTSVFGMAMELQGKASSTSAIPDGRIYLYIGNISPVGRDFDDPLGWWKVSFIESQFKWQLIL